MSFTPINPFQSSTCEMITCTRCGRVFTRSDALLRHRRSSCPGPQSSAAVNSEPGPSVARLSERDLSGVAIAGPSGRIGKRLRISAPPTIGMCCHDFYGCLLLKEHIFFCFST